MARRHARMLAAQSLAVAAGHTAMQHTAVVQGAGSTQPPTHSVRFHHGLLFRAPVLATASIHLRTLSFPPSVCTAIVATHRSQDAARFKSDASIARMAQSVHHLGLWVGVDHTPAAVPAVLTATHACSRICRLPDDCRLPYSHPVSIHFNSM
jgi:hypothetical protein